MSETIRTILAVANRLYSAVSLGPSGFEHNQSHTTTKMRKDNPFLPTLLKASIYPKPMLTFFKSVDKK